MPTTDTPSIIAACDGADRGRQAVALARIIAEATGALLTIAAVYPHPGLPFVGSRHTSAERRMSDADHALQVLHSTHAAVLVVPDDHPVAPGIRRIVVGF